MALATEARKPFYAYVGAVDLAVEKTRELPATLVSELPGRAFSLYGDLIRRGEKLVGSIKRSPSTRVATAQVKNAQAKAKAATTSATKAAKATAKAVENATGQVG